MYEKANQQLERALEELAKFDKNGDALNLLKKSEKTKDKQ